MDLPELERRVDRIQGDLEDHRARLTAIETDHKVADVHRINVENRLASIEDTLKWIVRLIVGAIILALIGYVVQSGAPI